MAVFSLLTDEQKIELWSCLALKHSRGLGLHSGNALIEHYGSALEAVELGRRAPGCWVSEGLVNERTAKTFANESWRQKARSEWEALQRPGCQFLYRTHHAFPHLLTEIHDAPLILYYTGDVHLLSNPMIGVVGSRKCSEEGILACATLARQLSSFGVTIVSGLAKGIDRAAHVAGLSALGSSIAVLGTGIDVVYPESNEDVFMALEEKGLILSEFSPGTMPYAKNFPIRNRIISGLSRGVIIVEAAKRSGSLITARLALEQGRDVFAIPGSSVGKYSEGCHELIRNGAKPVFSAEDVVADLAPLLAVDVREQLQRLLQEEAPQSLAKFATALSASSGLPSLLEPQESLQRDGYRYGQASGAVHSPASRSRSGIAHDFDPPIGDSRTGHWTHKAQASSPELDSKQASGQAFKEGSQEGCEQVLESGHEANIESGFDKGPTQNLPPRPAPQPDGMVTNLPSTSLTQGVSLADASQEFITQRTKVEGNSSEKTTVTPIMPDEADLEARLLALLHDDWRHIDWLCERLGLDASAVSTILTLLEVDGVVVQKPGMLYRLP